MQLTFVAKPTAPITINIDGTTVNGFDLSQFPVGATFMGNDDTDAAGIHHVKRTDDKFFVTLAQRVSAYECQPKNNSHDWEDTGDWIDAADYDPDRCYIVAKSAPQGAEYVKRENGWTVTLLEMEEEELV
ncbi:hypothetical protein [Halomonas sp. DWK9]|uniref:hypothetical protein n=1 Tax=Halomonas sp. DWK9 TaxID=3060155 RepID=UPI00287FE086|nr:hypothetical protein [Halomonas sp. DWK9]